MDEVGNVDATKPKLFLMVGLPRSGKTTIALKIGHPVVCPDAIRLVLHGQAFRQEAEPMVWAIAKTMVASMFAAGHRAVILDACNISIRRREEWKDDRWLRYYLHASADKETCIQRAAENRQQYLIPIIERMADEFEAVGPDEQDRA